MGCPAPRARAVVQGADGADSPNWRRRREPRPEGSEASGGRESRGRGRVFPPPSRGPLRNASRHRGPRWAPCARRTRPGPGTDGPEAGPAPQAQAPSPRAPPAWRPRRLEDRGPRFPPGLTPPAAAGSARCPWAPTRPTSDAARGREGRALHPARRWARRRRPLRRCFELQAGCGSPRGSRAARMRGSAIIVF